MKFSLTKLLAQFGNNRKTGDSCESVHSLAECMKGMCKQCVCSFNFTWPKGKQTRTYKSHLHNEGEVVT